MVYNIGRIRKNNQLYEVLVSDRGDIIYRHIDPHKKGTGEKFNWGILWNWFNYRRI